LIEEKKMNKLYSFILTLADDEKAQDMVEYSLLAGFIAVAAGAVLPTISASISTIFSKMVSITTLASTK
jgi:pilus assembly protein Flp/PilA